MRQSMIIMSHLYTARMLTIRRHYIEEMMTNEEKLIELIPEYSLLYDINRIKYNNTKIKERVWIES